MYSVCVQNKPIGKKFQFKTLVATYETDCKDGKGAHVNDLSIQVIKTAKSPSCEINSLIV